MKRNKPSRDDTDALAMLTGQVLVWGVFLLYHFHLIT
jgi:hypothetical protein